VDEDSVRFFTEALFNGSYPAYLMEWIGAHRPVIQAGDMEVIRLPIDFLGINYYMTFRVGHAQSGGLLKAALAPYSSGLWRPTVVDFGVNPAGLTDLLLNLRKTCGNIPLYITENGAAVEDQPDANGYVTDWDRVDYLRAHLRALWEAMQAGVDVRGYYVWSLLDNFEWAHGYKPRFGIVRVDYPTGKRIPKKSAEWYRDMIKQGTLEA
jgi:beta-glucosidase